MAKLVVGTPAETFPLTVQIPTPRGDDQVIFDAKHLASTVWCEMREAHTDLVNSKVQGLFDAARAAAEAKYAAQQKTKKPLRAAKKDAVKDAQAELDAAAHKEAAIDALVVMPKQSVIRALQAKVNGEMMVEILTGWDLDDAFDVKALIRMCDLYPAAAPAVFAAYNQALEGHRLGN